ncbi:MAG: DM13 domain-containing protein [Acidimicrobiia bacterium]
MSNRLKLVIAVLAVPALALGWWLGSPLFLDRAVDEAFPISAPVAAEAAPTTTVATEQTDPVEMSEETAEGSDEVETEDTTEEPGPLTLSTGAFQDADSNHRGSGTATIYELEDGSHLLRFEDFEVTNGPDLRVILVPNGDPQKADDIAGYRELEPLKGNVGNQNYEIPADVDLSLYGSVVIYCKPFHVLFAVASLET